MTAPTIRSTSVFISYSRIDGATINRLEAELISYGFRTWVDREHLEGGDKWAAQIERAIEACDVVVVGLSPDAIASSWVINELFYAQQLGKPIIPVVLRPVERVPLLLAAIQYIDMQADESQGLQQLRLRLLRLGDQPVPVVAIQDLYVQGIVASASGNLDQAKALLRQVVERDPQFGNGVAAAQLAQLARLIALPAPAAAADLNDLFVQGIAARSRPDLDQAEALLRQVVERDPQFGNGVAAQELAKTQHQLLPIQLERLREQAQQAEEQGAWGEAIGAWQAFLERAPNDVEVQTALKRDEQNRDAAWIYNNARALVQQQDWAAFHQMWRMLQEQAPDYGDPDGISFVSQPAGTLLLTFKCRTGRAGSGAWSPDGQRLATACDDKTVRVWDAGTGKQVLTFRGQTGEVNNIAWSPDGQKLATSGNDHMVQILDAATGKQVLTFKGHTSAIFGVAWSPNGQWLATASGDGKASVWEAATGKQLLTFKEHRQFWLSEAVFSVAWSPDGQKLATSGNDQKARVWDATTGKQLLTLKGHYGGVNTVVWSPDGLRLATSGKDQTASVWDATTGKQLLICRGHTGSVDSVAWSRDGQRLATAGWDHKVRVWDAATGKLLLTIECDTWSLNSVAWAPDGLRLATAAGYSGTVQVWRV